jgi:uncharacterized protein (DUF983 family)
MSKRRQHDAHGSPVRGAPHSGSRLTYFDHACPSCGSSLASEDYLLQSYKCHGCGRESSARERPEAVNDWSVLEPSAPPFTTVTAKWRGVGVICDGCGKNLYQHGGEVRFGYLRLDRLCTGWVRART